mmetsp:Transcript_25018/g.63438  ORF Transcript_25018/g.63438 Transcript_25018/m.63438 type:complete len:828 (-) Transcript_25018:92-2575(-)
MYHVGHLWEDMGSFDSTFRGIGGATSLKAEISQRVPNLNDAAAYREARHHLQQLGGAMALHRELTFSGFVDPNTNSLTTNAKPFNLFAHLASGKSQQLGMEQEQLALGAYRDRFMICCNQPEMDLHWDSTDSYWVRQASMATRHRFLTTRKLHWQWFNALVFGLVPAESGGVSMREALQEVEAMRDAALLYAKNMDGWSEKVGLFVNVFGHNNVNSLFVHILDMSELGPGFKTHIHKNLPLEDVIKVLKEDASPDARIPGPPASPTPEHQLPALSPQHSQPRRRSTPQADGEETAPLFFTGTEGATSLKDELCGRVPVLRDASGFREVRRVLKQELGGIASLQEELLRFNIIEPNTTNLTTGTSPLNLFARIVSGKLKQPLMEAEQAWLGSWQDRYQICCNLPENEVHWDSDDPAWVGRASMSLRHRFMTTKNLHWQWFNALAFGLVPEEEGGLSLEATIQELQDMKAAALTYTSNADGWSSHVGLFFHVFGHNSVNSLHLHLVDMDHLGPTYRKLEYKNCSIDAVIKVLEEEMALLKEPPTNDNMLEASTQASTREARAAIEGGSSFHANSPSYAASESSGVKAVPCTTTSRSSGSGGGIGEVLELSVGGEIIVVPVATLMIAPDGSRLKEMFTASWNAAPLKRDDRGRIFLNLPPRSFRIILDHLRMVQCTSDQEVVEPPVIPRELRAEVEHLEWHLGVGFLLEQPVYGQAVGQARRCGSRPQAIVEEPPLSPIFGALCCHRRRRRASQPLVSNRTPAQPGLTPLLEQPGRRDVMSSEPPEPQPSLPSNRARLVPASHVPGREPSHVPLVRDSERAASGEQIESP